MPNRRRSSRLALTALLVALGLSFIHDRAHAPEPPPSQRVTLITFPALSYFAQWEDEQERLALSALEVALPELSMRSWDAAGQFLLFEQRDLLIERGHCLESNVDTPLRDLLLRGALCELSLAIGVEPRWELVIDHLSQLLFQSGHVTPYHQVRELESQLQNYWFEFITSLWPAEEPASATTPHAIEEETI